MIEKLHKCEQEILDEIVRICRKYDLKYVLIGGTLLGSVRHNGFIPWDDDLDIAMPRSDYERFKRLCIDKKVLKKKFYIDDIETNKHYWLPFSKVRNIETIYEEKWQKDYKSGKGIWVDIFPLDNAESENSEYKKEKYIKTLKGMLYLKNLRKIVKEDSLIRKLKLRLIKLFPNGFLHFIINRIMTLNKNENLKYFVNFGSQYGVKKQTHPKDKYFPAKELEFEGKMYKVPNDYDYVLKKIYGDNYMELPPEEKRVTHYPIRVKFEDGEEYKFEQ